MDIVPTSVSDTQVLELFSEHDDYMIDFLGNDKNCYTRYSAAENIEEAAHKKKPQISRLHSA